MTCANVSSSPEAVKARDELIKEVIEKSQTFKITRARRPTEVRLGLRQIFIAWEEFRTVFPDTNITLDYFIKLAEAGEGLMMLCLKIKLTQNIDEITVL